MEVQHKDSTVKAKKKKCRGDRKRQRFRRQLYRQGLDSDTIKRKEEEKFGLQSTVEAQPQRTDKQPIIEDIEVYIPLNRITLSQLKMNDEDDAHQNDNPFAIKRKRFILTPTPTIESRSILDKPCSPSIALQHNAKKSKMAMTLHTATSSNVSSPMNEIQNFRNDEEQQHKPHYLKVSDRIFKKLLADASDNGSHLVECLNTPEKLQRIRELTEITNNFYFKDFQAKLWQTYTNISSMDNEWEFKTTKKFAHEHNTCRMYRPKKSFIQQRQTTSLKQKQCLEIKLQENRTQLLNEIVSWQPSIEASLLSDTIDNCVRHKLRRLKEEYLFKMDMIKLNWTDQNLIRKFYELKPHEDVIQAAKYIWQIVADELRTKEKQEIFRQCIYLKRLPNKIEQLLNNLLEHNRKTVNNSFNDQDQRASCDSRCLKMINQCQFNLLLIYLDEFTMCLHRYNSTYMNLKDQLMKNNRENSIIYTNILVNLIEERRQAIIQRFNRIRQHTLKTFFDQAPAVNFD
ncbi:unnamed protein product [Rotaria socialis]|uniref:Uncharacterized protein n=1 Tax=Rotaria socialis TaxID=392032 RepID=A0A821SZK8_9BILA|nr:unnamed protein product [Rotaria socialis]CAF3354922.1 unnamed protein product [Rotaria socialis]CAF3487829.1 unnamed protein product [Rotaria socialis]CAF4508380.1 unnamed protein product [Rotaria socialis]CAF4528581.1 unnamed protein product [Rotaria socialis]